MATLTRSAQRASAWAVGTRQVVFMAIGAALYGVLGWATSFLRIPGPFNTSIRPAVVIPMFFGAIFGGMLVGVLLVGFVGRRKKPAATKPDEKRADAKSSAAPAPEAKPSAAGEQKPDEPMARLPAPPSG